MKKQTIIVTGVSSDISKEIARYFLKNGDNVVINALTMEKLNEVFRDLGGGENLAMVPGNVSDRVTGMKLLAVAVGKFGSADVLVNTAGFFEARPFLTVNEAYLERYLDANLKGPFFTIQGIIPQMLKQGDGVVINIGTPLVSYAGSAPTIGALESKGVIHLLTIQLAAEFGKHGIRFNTVATGSARVSLQGDITDWSTGQNSLNHGGEVEDIAKMVYTVAKSNFISGSTININGGMALAKSNLI